MDRFDAMATLVAVVEAGSLSAGARALGTPLATVSRKVAALEVQLRTRLLVRTSRRLMLTEAGEAYVAAARRILEQIDDAEREAAGEYRAPKGDLTIAASLVFGRLYATPVVLEFLRAYPEVNVRLALADQVVDLVESHIDIAIRIGALPDSGLMAQHLGAIQWVTCASPAYLAAHGTPAQPADLQAHRCISFTGTTRPENWDFEIDGRPVSIPIRARFAVNGAEAVIDAAIAGAGIARVLSYQVAAATEAGALIQLFKGYAPAALPVHFVYAAAPIMPLKRRAFLDFAGPRLRAALGRTPRG